eukprot:1562312-Heterocapsa_arctica.AAC.1
MPWSRSRLNGLPSCLTNKDPSPSLSSSLSFPRKHVAMCSAASLDSLAPLSRWANHKSILREVAR